MLAVVRSVVLGLALALLALTPAFADDAQMSLTSSRVTAFPQVTLRFAVKSANGEPLPILGADNLDVTENGRSVGTFDVYPLDQSPTPLAMVIAMDASGSMNAEGKLAAAKAAAKTFVGKLRPIDQVEIISFGDTVKVVVPFTHDHVALARGIDQLGAKGQPVFRDATDRAVNDVLRVGGTHLVVLITDGQDMVSQAKLAPALDLARQSQVPIYTIGLGGNVQDDVLQRMADETSGHYFKAPRADDLAVIFNLLTQELAHQYELYYISPLAYAPAAKVDVVVRTRGLPGAAMSFQFSYAMPTVKSEVSPPVDPGELSAVVDPPLPTPVPSPTAPPAEGYPEGLPALLAVAAVLAAGAGLFLRLNDDPAEARLVAYVAGFTHGLRRNLADRPNSRLFAASLRQVTNLFAHLVPTRQFDRIERNLTYAGHPYGWGATEFVGVRVLLALLLAVLGYVGAAGRVSGAPVLFGAALGLLGFLLPAVWLGARIRARQQAITRAMPNALDLLAVTVEAGLGFDQAVGEVCRMWRNQLTDEFEIFRAELAMGRNRREALREITERTGVAELSGFVGAVIQADEMGASIARTLAVQAEQIRLKHRQAAEKRAREAAVKMIFPLVFLIFPTIFVVILGPAIPTIAQAFQSVHH